MDIILASKNNENRDIKTIKNKYLKTIKTQSHENN